MEPMSGEGFVFSVFPGDVVRANMQATGITVSLSEVERLWAAYQKALDEGGLSPYSKAGGGKVSAPLLAYMTKETGYSKAAVAAWLNALEKAVLVDGWDWKWLDPRAAKAAGISLTPSDSLTKASSVVGQVAENALAPALDPVVKIVKYGTIAIAVVGLGYLLYTGTNLFKKRKRARG